MSAICGWNQVLSCWVRSPEGWAQTGFFPFKCVFSPHSQPLHPHSKGEWYWSKSNWCCYWAWVWAWTVSSLAGVGDLDSWCNMSYKCPCPAQMPPQIWASFVPNSWASPSASVTLSDVEVYHRAGGTCAVLSIGWDMDCGSPRQRLVPFMICFLYKQQYISCPCPAQMPCWSDLFSVVELHLEIGGAGAVACLRLSHTPDKLWETDQPLVPSQFTLSPLLQDQAN